MQPTFHSVIRRAANNIRHIFSLTDRSNIENADLLVGFDENADANQFFAWHEVQCRHNKLDYLKELDLCKQ